MNKLLASQIKKTIANTKGLTKTQSRLIEDINETYIEHLKMIDDLKKTKPEDIHKLIEKNHKLQSKIASKDSALKEFKALSDEIIPKNSSIGSLLSHEEQLGYIINYLKWLRNEKKRAFTDLSDSKVTTDIILDNWNDGIIILDKNGKVIKINQRFLKVLRAEGATLMGKNIQDISSILSAENKSIVSKYFFNLLKGKKSTTIEVEEEKNKEKYYLKISGSAIKIRNEMFGVMFVIEDITEQKEIESTLIKRKQLIEAVNQASTKFLTDIDWTKYIDEILKIIGVASNASRVYIFQNHERDGEVVMQQLYEWTADNISPQIDNETLQFLEYKEAGIKRWVDLLSNKDNINEIVSKLPKKEQSMLISQDIKSILIVPVFVDKKWWGFIGFDECRFERAWTKLEVDSLLTFSNIIGVAIHRTATALEIQNTNKVLEDKNNKLKQINRLMIGRELKMIELKKQILKLESKK